MRTYLGIDPVKQPIPIQPTAHYAMGGIPTDVDGRVVIDEQNTPLPGFYAAGECACVSVHGANRLGTNSLVDIIVFGRRAGRAMRRVRRGGRASLPLPADAEEHGAGRRSSALLPSNGHGERPRIRPELQEAMMDNASVFRDEETDCWKMAGEARRAAGALRRVTLSGPGQALQHRLWRRSSWATCWTLRGDRGRRAGPDGEPRRPLPRGLPEARRRQLAEAHPGLQDGRQGIELSYKPVTITRFQPQGDGSTDGRVDVA